MAKDEFPFEKPEQETNGFSAPGRLDANADSAQTAEMTTPYGTASGVRRVPVMTPGAEPRRGGTVDDDTAVLSALGPDTPSGAASTPATASPTNSPTNGAVPAAGADRAVPAAGEVAAGAVTTTTKVEAAPASLAESGLAPVLTDTASEPHPASRRRRWPLWAGGAALLLVGGLGVGSFAYASHYEELALPHTTVAGMDVSGMSRAQIVTAVQDKADSVSVSISGDTTATASLADLGVTVDAEATADAALAPSSSVVNRFTSLVSHNETAVVTSTDQAVAQGYAESLVPAEQARAHNADVVLSEDSTSFTVSPASDGMSVDAEALVSAADEGASSLRSQSLTVSFIPAEPTVSDEQAQEVADQANAWVAQDVTISNADDTEVYTADDATKASWITVTATADAPPSVSVDGDKVATWVQEAAEEAKVAPVTGKRNVSPTGDVLTTSVEAVAGQTVSNASDVTTAITTAFGSDQGYHGSFEMAQEEPMWDEQVIAEGAEDLAYPAAPGEKWIDINLSSKTVTAYEGATVVHGPVSVVDGAEATPTVTGTFQVYLKYESQTMRGENADGSNYVTEGVPWISYFYAGYALHGADWRSSFGYSDSHGCLNMPVSEAKWFFDWDEIGTVVVSHY